MAPHLPLPRAPFAVGCGLATDSDLYLTGRITLDTLRISEALHEMPSNIPFCELSDSIFGGQPVIHNNVSIAK